MLQKEEVMQATAKTAALAAAGIIGVAVFSRLRHVQLPNFPLRDHTAPVDRRSFIVNLYHLMKTALLQKNNHSAFLLFELNFWI